MTILHYLYYQKYFSVHHYLNGDSKIGREPEAKKCLNSIGYIVLYDCMVKWGV